MCDYSLNVPETQINKMADAIDYFLTSRDRPIKEMLEFLLILSNTIIQSDKDCAILNREIVDLILRTGKLFYSQYKLENWQMNFKSDIYVLGNKMAYNDDVDEFAKGSLLDLTFRNKLIQIVQKFKTEFVDNATFL
jgi:hypothetical protein